MGHECNSAAAGKRVAVAVVEVEAVRVQHLGPSETLGHQEVLETEAHTHYCLTNASGVDETEREREVLEVAKIVKAVIEFVGGEYEAAETKAEAAEIQGSEARRQLRRRRVWNIYPNICGTGASDQSPYTPCSCLKGLSAHNKRNLP